MNCIVFTSLPSQKIEFYNKLNSIFKSQGIDLFLIVLDEFSVNLNELNFENYLSFYSADLTKIWLPNKIDSIDKIENLSEHYDRIINLQNFLFESNDIKSDVFIKMINSFYNIINQLINEIMPDFAIRNLMARPTHEISRIILREQNIEYFDYQAWVYPRTYQFSKKLWNPISSVEQTANSSYQEFNELMKLSNQKRNKSKELPYQHKNEYVLYLTGGLGSGASLPYVEDYYSIGSGWGNDVERVNRIESLLSDEWKNCDLLVRQHPNAKPKITPDDFINSNSYIVNNYSLNDLIKNAKGVICGQTTLVYHALKDRQYICILGHHELENDGIMVQCNNFKELKDWLVKLKTQSLKKPEKDRIDEAVIKYINNAVFALDFKSTYNVITSKFSNKNNENLIRDYPSWKKLQR